MKVLHVVHQYPPEFRGGTEACVAALASAQRRRGDLPIVLAGSDQRDPAGGVVSEEVDGIRVHRVRRRPGENYSADYRLDRVATQVLGLAADERPDVVHLHHTLNLSADLAARLAGAGHKVVATLHDFTLVCARFFLARPDGESCARAFPLPSERCVDCVLPDFPAGRAALSTELDEKRATAAAEAAAIGVALVPSEVVRDRWLKSGLFAAEDIVTVPHAVPLAASSPGPPRPRDDGRLVIATWGHLAPAKGVLDLIEAIRRLADPRVSLVVLGQPIDDAHDRELRTASAGLDVTFRGGYAEGDLPALRGEADLAVFPSRAEETFGLAVAEARAVGLPVVVSDRGALPERVGSGGTTVPAADPGALATLLVSVLADGARLERWAAGDPSDLLTPERHADIVASLYQRAQQASPR